MKRVLCIIVVVCLLLPGTATAWDTADKMLFFSVAAMQTVDGLYTRDKKIIEEFSWKYRSNPPSDANLFAVKAAELGLAYVIADALPSRHRKAFLTGCLVLLSVCLAHNFNVISIEW